MDLIPVILFCYKRTSHLNQVLESLHINNVPLIYAFSDGPRNESEVDDVNKVRGVLKSIDWCEIYIHEEQNNLGLGTSIRKGVSQVLKQYKKAIIVEDDILFRPGAYKYVCNALDYYEKYDNVMTISMWNHPVIVPRKEKNGFFSERFMCWGWATYSKYWELYDDNIENIYNSLENDVKSKIDKYGRDLFRQVQYSNKTNIWYVGYAILHFKLKKLSFFPYETLVVNIGKDETAEHDGAGHTSYLENTKLIKKKLNVNAQFPSIRIVKNIDRKFRRYFYLKHPDWKLLIISIKKMFYPIYKMLSKGI